MNYHLMIDDKFIDGFIADMEAAVPGGNVYIFTFDPPSKYVTSEQGVHAAYGSDRFREIASQITSGDRVLVHWLHDAAAQFILGLSNEVEVGAFFWGADFIGDPFYFFKRSLLGPLSLRLYNSRLEYPIFTTRNPVTVLRRLRYRVATFRKVQNQRAALKRSAVSRLDFLFHWNLLDHRHVERLYGTTIKPMYFHYDVGLSNEVEELRNPYLSRKSRTRIWLGNSSSVTNNHFEALEILAQYKDRDIEIFCPLSYGDMRYGQVVQRRGEQIFGSKFRALNEFIDRGTYYSLMDGADVVIMNHFRTQAAGNTWAFLKLGKKIFMHRDSTLFQLLSRSGIEVFDLSTDGVRFDEFVEPLRVDVPEKNFKIMKSLFSEESKRATLEALR